MEDTKNKETWFRRFVRNTVNNVEKLIIKVLILLMSLLLIAATAELAYQTIISLISLNSFLIDTKTLMDLFGVFLLVLIGIELLDTIKVYFKKNVVHVEVVILVAIIAVARKVIVLDFDKYSGLEVIGIGFVVIALSASYYMIKKAGGCQFYTKEKEVIKIDPETKEKKKVVEEKTVVKDKDGNIIESDTSKIKDTPCGGG